jgi:hypothetical protein
MRPGNPSMPGPGRSCRKGAGHHTSPAWEAKEVSTVPAPRATGGQPPGRRGSRAFWGGVR